MKTTLALGAALASLMIGAGAAHAETGDHSGLSVSTGAGLVDADITYSGGKPTAALSGAMADVRVGFDWQFGETSGPVIGASYTKSVGDGLNAGAIRDGNYIVQGASLDGVSVIEARAGWAFGRFLPYVAYGKIERDGEVSQSCPNDPASTVAGFCYGGGVAATQQARKGRTTAELDGSADLLRVGIEINVTPNVFVDLNYATADFGRTVTPYANAAIPATDPTQEIKATTLRVGYRF